MSHPQRIQLRRSKGWRMPANTVKVDRSTKFGNPYTIKGAREAGYRGTDAEIAAMCVFEFREWMRSWVLTDLQAALRGKNLACWCPLPKEGEPDLCHAAVLLRIANE